MMRRAIACGFRRIEFRVDCTQSSQPGGDGQDRRGSGGVLRADRITWTGHVRDTVLFLDPADANGRRVRLDRD
jgi:hypothetical protein